MRFGTSAITGLAKRIEKESGWVIKELGCERNGGKQS